ncbi:MAG: diacylglycerol kinase family protein [Chloroflexi bacterium]|nr:diacylglycerol kinase family protein [Chloroflexota bacterium]
MRARLLAFKYAFSGWWFVLLTQRNAWIHALISTAVVLLGLWLKLSRLEWAMIVLTMAVVWMGEFLNTALEAVVDLASPELHPLATVCKDAGAAAVLIAALAAALVGLLILGPPLWARLFGG